LQSTAAHIFQDHLLGKQHLLPLPAPQHDPLWIPLFLVLCLVLLVVVKSTAFSHLHRIIQSTFSNQVLQQLEREEVNLFRAHALALNLLFLLNLAFLLFKFNQSGQFVLAGAGSFQQYCFFLLVILLLLCFKVIVNRFVAICTGDRKIINEYLISSALVNQTFGLVLFPCLVLLQFGELLPTALLYLAFVIVGAAVLLKWYRGLMMGLVAERLGFLQIFSYFCALEILPVLVLVKFVIETY
jgi:hypothetical protein